MGLTVSRACLQVLDEIGIDMAAGMSSAPQKKIAAQKAAEAQEEADGELDELSKRLGNLRS